jgi:hypothetical protein
MALKRTKVKKELEASSAPGEAIAAAPSNNPNAEKCPKKRKRTAASGVLGWHKTRACIKTVFYLSYFMLNAIPKKWFDLFF